MQRSFRLSAETRDLLNTRAAETSESRNALVERLIGEGLRVDRHPLIWFRTGGSGLRRPALVGKRLDVSQVIETVRAEGGDVASATEYLSVPERLIRAAVAYYADFTEEIDAYRADEWRSPSASVSVPSALSGEAAARRAVRRPMRTSV